MSEQQPDKKDQQADLQASAGAPAHPAANVAEHDNHGSTPANWTVSIIVTIAFLVGTLGVVLGQPVMFWVGVALIPIGLVIGKVLSGMGYGAAHHDS